MFICWLAGLMLGESGTRRASHERGRSQAHPAAVGAIGMGGTIDVGGPASVVAEADVRTSRDARLARQSHPPHSYSRLAKRTWSDGHGG